jgi:glycosyltransferase involved in cell wall biosynthesis
MRSKGNRLHKINQNADQTTSYHKLAFIGNYLPRQCGIATFTTDLCEAVAAQRAPQLECLAVAMNDIAGGYDYSGRVRYTIDQDDREAYLAAADYLNMSGVDVVCLQHEYGIFGGSAGEHILSLLCELDKPVVTTLHTVLREPNPEQYRVMSELARRSDRLVVMSARGQRQLEEIYHVPEEKIDLIPHGIPDIPKGYSDQYKGKLGLGDKIVLLTFGLLSPNKGLENVIRALPEVVRAHPEVVYLVVGATHPHVKRSNGEVYRQSLRELAGELGVEEHVRFYNQFVPLEELIKFIGLTDIYITPYLNPAQIVSGTLAYMVGAGKAVISTPYWYAEEMLADGRGLIVPFNDSEAIAEQTLKLLQDGKERRAMQQRAYQYGRDMIWPVVARRYMQSFERAKAEHRIGQTGYLVPEIHANRVEDQVKPLLPALRIDHLERMTDGTGIFQHAIFNVPNYAEGYTTDDNARALIAALELDSLSEGRVPKVQELASRYLAFLAYALDEESGRFRNFLGFDRRWLESAGSDDSQGRALWGLGAALGHSGSKSWRGAARRLFWQALPEAMKMGSPRAWAFTLLGISEYLSSYTGDRGLAERGKILVQRLVEAYQLNRRRDWHWFEDSVTYSNASLPLALMRFSPHLREPERVQAFGIALESLSWLVQIQTSPGGNFSPVGSAGFYVRGGKKAAFDQQPIEAGSMAAACGQAYRITGEEQWRQEAQQAFEWFLGGNDLGISLYDPETGGCCDGLHPDRVNQNQGAESLLAYLQARLEMLKLESPLVPAGSERVLFPVMKQSDPLPKSA